MTKHASIPWEVAHYEGGLLEGVNVIRQVSSKKDICTLGLPTEEDEANAAYIVRAANSHEAMLACLKNLLEMDLIKDKNGDHYEEILEIIAKAEGK